MGKDLHGRELGKGITQRKDGRYQARFTNRFGKRQTVYALSLEELDKKFSSAKEKSITKVDVKGSITIDQLFKIWINGKMNIKQTTKSQYTYIYNKYIEDIVGKEDISNLDYCMVVHVINTCKHASIKNVIKIILSGIFRTGILMDYCSKDYASLIEKPNKGNKKFEKIALSDLQKNSFLKAARGSRWEELYVIGFETGMRISEIAGLTWDSLNFIDNTINVDKQIVHYRTENNKYVFEQISPKTSSGIRVIPMTTKCKKALLNLRTKKDSNSLLVFTFKGRPIYSNPIYADMLKICNKIPNFPHVTPHTMRHTFATKCVDRGMRPELLKMILGHANISITLNIYYHTSKNNNVEILRCMEDLAD